ncbi:MAG TPA: amino acid ABC transporter substrate-binding protein [Candidatus Tectomicrobia bacterium]|nr:amino acid ABC transporter substrate-binding protein [Candidatus Tectomicrobia bacterium]
MLRGMGVTASSILLAFSLVVLSATTVHTQPKVPEAILIGATIAQSGPMSAEVGPFKKMMDVWAEMVNDKGGLSVKGYSKKLPVKFVVYDDASKQENAVKFYERLVTVDRVHLLLGPYSSPLTFAASTVAENHGIPMVAAEANSTAIFTRSFKWLVGVIDDGPKWSSHYFDLLKAAGKAKSIGFVIQDTLHAKEVGSGAVPRAREIGLEVVFEETVQANITDFTPTITKLKTANPDIIYVSAFPPFAIGFYKQALELGLNPREYHIIHHGAAFRNAVGKANANYVTGENYWMPGISYGKPEVFEEVLKRAGIRVEDYPWASIHMFAFEAIQAALDQAQSLQPEALLTALKGLDIMTIGGRLRFDPKTGQGTLNPFPTQIQNGKYVTLWPQEIATGSHVYPRPAK